jgi:hypothetical protein
VTSSGRRKAGARGLSSRALSWLGALTGAALLLTTLLGGQRYFYCRVMRQVMAQTCACAPAHRDPTHQSVVAIANDCWEVRVVARLLSLGAVSGVDVQAASSFAIAPEILSAAPPSAACAFPASHSIRAGPFSPAAARSRLMVYLT